MRTSIAKGDSEEKKKNMMEDLFQYLIYGILIFSFLSSFFKKKEPPKQTPQKPAQKPESISYQIKEANQKSGNHCSKEG